MRDKKLDQQMDYLRELIENRQHRDETLRLHQENRAHMAQRDQDFQRFMTKVLHG